MNKEPKVVFISATSTKSAVAWRIINLSKAFENKIVVAQEEDYMGRTTEENIYKIKSKVKGGFGAILQLYKILKKENPDLIVYIKPASFSTIASFVYKIRNRDVKVIADYDEYEPATKSRKPLSAIMYYILHHFSNIVADGIVASNRKTMKHIPKRKPSIHLPNAADPEKIKPAQMKKHKKFTLAYFGNLDYTSPQLNTLLQLSKEMKEYRFILFGKVFNVEEFKKISQDAELGGEYTLDNMSKMAEETDVLVCMLDKTPGNSHASNMKVFDYMCMKKPIIVSDTGELKEYIHYPEGGYVAQNKEELKKTIEHIKNNYQEATKKAAYARKLAETVESWDARRKKFKEFALKIITPSNTF